MLVSVVSDEERNKILTTIPHICATCTTCMFTVVYFTLSNLAVLHDRWKELCTDLLDITLLRKALEIGIYDCYEKFIHEHARLGIHLFGFLLSTTAVTSLVAFLLAGVAGIIAEIA